MIQSQPLDIHGQGLYSSYTYNYPMVELQETLFRYSPDLDTSNSQNDFVVQPLNQGAKKRIPWNKGINHKVKSVCGCCNEEFYHYLSETRKYCSRKCFLKRYSYIKIDGEKEQILVGSLLGDGYIAHYDLTSQYNEGHSDKQLDYLNWKINKFNFISTISTAKHNSKKNKHKVNILYSMRSYCMPQLNKYHQMFYPNGKKVVTKEILDKLGPLGLAVWHMDDGHFNYRGLSIELATQGFNFEGNKLIKDWFREKYDINFRFKKYKLKSKNKIYYGIKCYGINTKKFIKIIEPYIIPSMKYKIGLDKEKLKKARQYDKQYQKKLRKNYSPEDKKRIKEHHKNYYNTNKIRILKQIQGYYHINKEKISNRGRGYRIKNREKIAEKYKVYREKNRDKLIAYSRKYQEQNKEKLKEKRKLKYDINHLFDVKV